MSTQTKSQTLRPLRFLSRLRTADPADILRPQKLKKNAAPVAVGKKRSHMAGRSAHNPESTSPYQRAREFPDENLTVSCGKLFCSGCREELGLKLTVIRLHIKSKKHQAGKERQQSNEAHERDIATSFAMYCDMRIENNTRFVEHNCCLRICEESYKNRIMGYFWRIISSGLEPVLNAHACTVPILKVCTSCRTIIQGHACAFSTDPRIILQYCAILVSRRTRGLGVTDYWW